jgi:proteasome accessory factor A
VRFAEQRGLPPLEQKALEMWQHCVEGLERDPLSLDRECDWVIKHKLVEAFRERHELPLGHPRVALLDLQYHDVSRERGVFYRMQDRGLVERIVTDQTINDAMEQPPATTRARLRGEFIRRAKEKRRDFTVDWVHLKLNDQTQRTVLLKDPFRAHDERVERLIEAM